MNNAANAFGFHARLKYSSFLANSDTALSGMFILFSAVLHSELTTQRYVTPKRIKKENKEVEIDAQQRLVVFLDS